MENNYLKFNGFADKQIKEVIRDKTEKTEVNPDRNVCDVTTASADTH